MSQAETLARPGQEWARRLPIPIDAIVAIAVVVGFGLAAWTLQYKYELAEYDLYSVLVGLLDGAASGKFLNGGLHYDRDFGFGYVSAIYAFADPATLRDPDRLAALMNQIGLWAMLPSLLCLWCAICLRHGARAATVAVIVFATAPMIPELATSGHPVIPMFGLLCAAAILMFLPLQGWRAMVAPGSAAILLLAGLVVRGEIFLAFPWLVLSSANTQSIRSFAESAILRSIAPLSALVAFFVLQRYVSNTAVGSTVGHYFITFYAWGTIAPGLVYMAVGCGILTAVAGFAAALWLIWRGVPTIANPFANGNRAALLGPIALVVVPMAFFLPNPQPTRHFMMPLAGLAILIAIVLTSWPKLSRIAALAIALGFGVVNQVLAEAARPVLLRINDSHTAYLPLTESYRTTTHANLGWVWERHAALVARRTQWRVIGEKIRNSCDAKTMVFSDEHLQLFSRLYAGGYPVEAGSLRIGPFYAVSGTRAGKTFIVVEKASSWPNDAVATVLADPAYADYRLFNDPYTTSKYDLTPIPASRLARFDCPEAAEHVAVP